MTSAAKPTVLAACSVVVALLLLPATASAAPGFVVSGFTGVPTEEGDSAQFTVSLAGSPTSEVTISATSLVPGAAVVVPAELTFSPGSSWWPQTFWVMGLDDELQSGDTPVSIELAVVPGSDPAYVGLPPVVRNTSVLDDEVTLTIESGPSICIGPTTEDIYDGSMVITRYDRQHPDAAGLWFDPANEAQDDLVVHEHSDDHFVALRTLHVVLRNTLSDSMADDEVEALTQMYATAAHHIHVASGGMLMLEYDQIVVDEWFGEGAFGVPGTPKEGDFVGYSSLEWEIMLAGYVVDDFDIINISVGIAQSEVTPISGIDAWAYAKPSETKGAFTNASTWDNDHTWTTVQFASKPTTAGMRDVFLHEMNHTVEFMLEYSIYPEHRNADDPWWLATYPGYALGSKGFDHLNVLTMFWARPKFFYDYLPDTWGELRTRTPMHVVETSCPSESTLQMRRAYCEHGVSCDSICYINTPCSSGCYCNTEPRGGGGGGGKEGGDEGGREDGGRG